MQAIETEFEPKMAELSDLIYQNSELFQRIKAIYESIGTSTFNDEQVTFASLPSADLPTGLHRTDPSIFQHPCNLHYPWHSSPPGSLPPPPATFSNPVLLVLLTHALQLSS
jgi:hypothetical protein